MARPVMLGDGVWIGARSIVCPGVVAEEHSVLTAGSVIIGHMEANMVYQGNPARVKRSRT
jgi:putative colanic acid biosynthesis acetyltransferase WcaF